MVQKKKDMINAIILAGVAIVAPSFVSANDIALTFEGNGMVIAGEYAGFSEGAYIIVTSAGILHVPANLVTCAGADCIEILTSSSQVTSVVDQ